ncbi:3-dehydroquinate synthase [Phycisphaerales bacterium AB-hyl4]|uniref:3-dehydroquinate synthase n=1 Tax=Natronomicrosphaera hydrolytica TaxID=3242702 RepID=A0ABV4UAC1_9BACT
MKPNVEIALRLLHRIQFTDDALAIANPVLRDSFESTTAGPVRVLPFVDEGVLQAFPDFSARLQGYADAHGDRMTLATDVRPIVAGEACKNDWQHVEQVLSAINHHDIDRQSYILAVGGGAVLDCVGFAASIAHRGIRLIRMPSTTLAQGDAGIGVKNGVNAYGKKNFLGTFAVPHAVINDISLLAGLSSRQWRSGFSESVKVALLKDAALFDRIAADAEAIAAMSFERGVPIIERSAELHVKHIAEGGDPFELRNARPLDFGHWSAHRLETMSDYTLPHGEAVAIGIALDTAYARQVDLLGEHDAKRIFECLAKLGFELANPLLEDVESLWVGLKEFREHLGGQLTLTLPTAIGRTVDVHEIDREHLERAIKQLTADK